MGLKSGVEVGLGFRAGEGAEKGAGEGGWRW